MNFKKAEYNCLSWTMTRMQCLITLWFPNGHQMTGPLVFISSGRKAKSSEPLIAQDGLRYKCFLLIPSPACSIIHIAGEASYDNTVVLRLGIFDRVRRKRLQLSCEIYTFLRVKARVMVIIIITMTKYIRTHLSKIFLKYSISPWGIT